MSQDRAKDDAGRVVSLGKVKAARGHRCPVCNEPATVDDAPFCSKRCGDIDLGRWLRGIYRIPTPEAGSEGPDEDDS